MRNIILCKNLKEIFMKNLCLIFLAFVCINVQPVQAEVNMGGYSFVDTGYIYTKTALPVSASKYLDGENNIDLNSIKNHYSYHFTQISRKTDDFFYTIKHLMVPHQ